MADRIGCCVPFCRRTVKNDGSFQEWICGKHWPLVPRHIKAEWRTVKKRVRFILRKKPEYAEFWKMPKGNARNSAAVIWRRHHNAWKKCKNAAIEAAAGIG